MTSRSERPEVRVRVGPRVAQIQGYAEDVLKLTAGPLSDLLAESEKEAAIDANKPPGGKPGEVEIVLRFRDRTEYWRMTFCDCHDRHDGGWRLHAVVGVN